MDKSLKDQFELLYVHLPFCETRCHYCDFYALATHRVDQASVAEFYAALQKEIKLQIQENQFLPIKALFMGGGTPSMTPPEVMEEFLAPIKKSTGLANDYEWTIEVNPSSVDLEKLKSYASIGVNRVSMGIQSLDNGILKNLGRVHQSQDALKALDDVFNSGITNVSVDLMCGLPNQSLEQLQKDIEKLTSYPIQHLSCYLLTLPAHHPMISQLPSEKTQLEHLLRIDSALRKQGFDHYEISNFCRNGQKALHNLLVWKGNSYLGIGPSAHSFSKQNQKRWKNVSSIKEYKSKLTQGILPKTEIELLNSEQQNLEKWMLALRLSDGFPKNWIKTKGQIQKSKELIKEKYLETHPKINSHYRLTPKGFTLSDQIVLELL